MKRKFNPEAHKSRVLFFGIALSAVIISFQNCGQVKNVGSKDGSQITVVGKLESTPYVGVIGHYDPREPGRGPLLYNIQANGQVQLRHFEAPSVPPSGTCNNLSANHLTQLNAFIARASVCFYEVVVPEGVVCTMDYRYPYSVVESDGITYKLGEKASGCGDTFELCGADREPFKELILEIAQDLNTNCVLD